MPVVVVTGCYAQLEPEEVASIDGVDLVLGSREKITIFDHVGTFEKAPAPRMFRVGYRRRGRLRSGVVDGSRQTGRARILKVQDGCDYTCSFCTIPLARGASRSQPVDACVAPGARSSCAQGYREIVLTGVNVGDYGRKVRYKPPGSRCTRSAELNGLARLRISSIEPNLLTDEILEFVAAHRVMCRHFHIPLQSGSDGMLRGDAPALYHGAVCCRWSRKIRGADPGLRDRRRCHRRVSREKRTTQFEETYRFLNDLPVSYLHVFTYSERPNTPAATYANPVPPAKYDRSATRCCACLRQKKREAFYRTHGRAGK